jgi:hypothetical protein
MEEVLAYGGEADGSYSHHVLGQRINLAEFPVGEGAGALPAFASKRPLRGLFSYGWGGRQSRHYLYVDESEGTGTGYDRLYWDLDRDGSFAENETFGPMADPPAGAYPNTWRTATWMVFDFIPLQVDYGPSVGMRECRMLARLVMSPRSETIWLASPVRKGTVTLAGTSLDVLMTERFTVTGRYDGNATDLLITSGDRLLGEGNIKALRSIGGTVYGLSTTPAGDRLIVKPYTGPTGVLEVAGREEEGGAVSLQGGLISGDCRVSILGPTGDGGPTEGPSGVSSAVLPEGDYTPGWLSFNSGRTTLAAVYSYYEEGRETRRSAEEARHAIRIRRGGAFKIDFPRSGDVLFRKPKRNETLAPGATINVEAVLIDPGLDMMAMHIYEVNRATEVADAEGGDRTKTAAKFKTIEPTVVIRDSTGNTIAEGAMPFG